MLNWHDIFKFGIHKSAGIISAVFMTYLLSRIDKIKFFIDYNQ